MTGRSGRICIVRQYYYPLDPRVRREAEALARTGHEVDVVCLRRDDEPRQERIEGVNVLRLPMRHRRTAKGGVGKYLIEYLSFFVMAAFVLTWRQLRRRYDLVQVNTLPDALVFAAAIPRLTGAKIVLDLHECMPEFFATKFGLALSHPAVRALGLVERAAIGFSDAALTCTEQQRRRFVERGAPPGKVSVILNGSDDDLFRPRRPNGDGVSGGMTLISHGSIERHYGLDLLIRAVSRLRHEIEDLRVLIYGDGTQVPELQRLVAELELHDHVRFSQGFVPLDELIEALDSADAGVIPMRRDAFRDLVQTHKMYDFISMRKPVIISRTSSVAAYFDEDCFAYFDAGDEEDLARAIRDLYVDPARRARLAAHAAAVSEPYRWKHQRAKYEGVVSSVLGDA